MLKAGTQGRKSDQHEITGREETVPADADGVLRIT